MVVWQQLVIVLYAIISLLSFIKGFFEIKTKNNPFGLNKYLVVLGIFVWGDALVLGLFWLGICLVTLILHDWSLFLLTISVFWAVRSFGEINYWIAEQFAGKNRNLPQTLRFYTLFKSDAVWFVYQLIWQCVLVVSLIASIYFTKVWLNGI
jgi:hypothetical protein